MSNPILQLPPEEVDVCLDLSYNTTLTLYITPELFNSLNTMTMQIMLIRIPIGPLLIFEDGLNPSIGSALFARFSSISPIGFMLMA